MKKRKKKKVHARISCVSNWSEDEFVDKPAARSANLSLSAPSPSPCCVCVRVLLLLLHGCKHSPRRRKGWLIS